MENCSAILSSFFFSTFFEKNASTVLLYPLEKKNMKIRVRILILIKYYVNKNCLDSLAQLNKELSFYASKKNYC